MLPASIAASSLGLMTVAGFVLHIAAGTIGLLSGTIAIFARKGGRIHRKAGTVFFLSMLIMAVSAAYLAVVRPGQMVNLFIAGFVSYLVVTAWMAVQVPSRAIAIGVKVALAVAICLCAPLLLLCFELAFGISPFFKSAIPLKGPVLVALYSFTSVLVIAVVSDAKVVVAGGVTGPPRIARHLWRMCLGLTMAAGSAFTNGLPRLLPGPMHVTPIFFLPQFVPLILLIFWMVRVRSPGWYRRVAYFSADARPNQA